MGTRLWWQIELLLGVLVKEMYFGYLLLCAWKVARGHSSSNSMSPRGDPSLANITLHTAPEPFAWCQLHHLLYLEGHFSRLAWPEQNVLSPLDLALRPPPHPNPIWLLFLKIGAITLARNSDLTIKNRQRWCLEPKKHIHWWTINQQINTSLSPLFSIFFW